MATINRDPYKRSYLTRIFPDVESGGCYVQFFRHKMVVVDDTDFVCPGDVIIATLTDHGLTQFSISADATITPNEMWEFLVKWVSTKSALSIGLVSIHCPRGASYYVEVAVDDGTSEIYMFDSIVSETVALDSGRTLSVADCAAGIIGLGESIDAGCN